jgi:hypothetical protein
VSQQEWVLIVDPALAVGEIGVANTARDHVNYYLAGTRVGDNDVD